MFLFCCYNSFVQNTHITTEIIIPRTYTVVRKQYKSAYGRLYTLVKIALNSTYI